jgi:CDP-glycerol glycerophosphotransferase
MDILRRFPSLRLAVRFFRARLGRAEYFLRYSLWAKTNPKLIIFESFYGRSYNDNPRAVYERLLGDPRFADYSFVWVFLDTEKKLAEFPALERARLVSFGSSAYYKAYAQAGVWVTNSRLKEKLKLKKDQEYIQTWHGTPLKRLAHDIQVDGDNALHSKKELCKQYDINTRQYTAMVTSSPFMTEKCRSAFNLDALGKASIILEYGYPRNDILARNAATPSAEWKKRIGIDPDKKVILYAPTWRDNQYSSKLGYTYQTQLDFNALRNALGDEYVVLFRAHYFIANSFDFAAYDGFVVDVSKNDEIAELYLASDVLVTDYSSVFFDYAILNRPIIFYMYDLEQYQNELRGFYIPLEDLPGPISVTQDELHSALLSTQELAPELKEKRDAFRKRFNSLEDGDASARVADYILQKTAGSD